MNTNKQKNADHHDRLFDTALREVVGQETPPNLSKNILAAAGEKSQPVASLGILSMEKKVMTVQQQTRRKRNFYIGAALAASLLVAAGLIFPRGLKQATQEVAHSKALTPAVKTEITQDTKPEKPAGTTVELPEFEVISVTTTVEVPGGGTVLLSGMKRLRGARDESAESDEKGMTSDKLMMTVTPHIIIEEGEEERLSISGEATAKPAPPANTPGLQPGQMGLQGLINDAYAALPATSSPKQQSPAQTDKETLSFSMGFGRDPKSKRDTWGYGGGVIGKIAVDERNFVWRGKTEDLDRRVNQNASGNKPLTLGSKWAENGTEIPYIKRRFRNLGEQGQGPDASGDQYTRIHENPFLAAAGEQAVSTFSIDVDTASYSNVRQFLMQSGQLPPPDAVRIEELINYFDYDYTAPTDDTPFAAHVEVASCPWQAEHRLVRVGIKGHEIANEKRPQSNLVFLIDVSGSMNQQNKLPLLVEGLKMLTCQLGENDRVAIIVYASSEGLALPSTRGDQQSVILAALEKLRAGGSTAGGAGIQLAYKIAQENFIEGGVNRVILATDGDFNVGTTSTADLERLAESNAQETGVFLTVLGFGRGNLNDAMMEAISGKGNGNYHYVDNRAEARKVLVEEIAGTLVTIAKDVKIQIEFNPAQVAAYRLIGYENRMLKTQDFNDDKKDAGEIGAGHTVTAIYEVVPAGVAVETPKVDPLKYQLRAEAAAPLAAAKPASDADASDELFTLKLRYKQPDGDRSTKLEFPITDNGQPFAEASDDFKFASAVASFGMLLRHSEHSGNASYDAVLEIAEDGSGKDLHGYRAEFLQLVRQAKVLAGE